MNLQPPFKVRIIAAASYGIPLASAGPLWSVKGFLTISLVLAFYYIFRTRSWFVFHHTRQSVNLVLTYYLYRGVVTLAVFSLERITSLGGLQEWISDQIILQPLIFIGGVIFPIFFFVLIQTLFYVVMIVLVILALLGKWSRMRFLFRFIRKDITEIP